MRSRSDREIEIRTGQIELVEKDRGHVFVVVLPGVNQPVFVTIGEGPGDGRRFHELRPGADDGEDLQRQSSRPSIQEACHSTAFITVQSWKL